VLWAGGEPLSDAGAPTPLGAARRFLEENAALLGLSAKSARGLVRLREDPLSDRRLTRVLLEQVVEGIPVFEGLVSVQVDQQGRAVKLAAGALHGGRTSKKTTPVKVGPEKALVAAVADLRPGLKPVTRRRGAPRGPARATLFEKGPFASDVPASLVWFPTATGERLAWRLRIEPVGFPQVYDVLIDAGNGSLLYRRNLVRYAEGVGTVPQSDETAFLDARQPDEHPLGVNPSGPSDPPGGCPPEAGYLSRSLNAPFRDPGSVLFDGGRLRGNNTSVFRTTNGTFGALGTLDAGTWRFDYPLGSAESVETALFFSSNFAHDFFYDLGFDEAAGNFQVDNFGRGGAGGDPLRTLSRASGRNNATFEPTPEGQSPTMSLFLFDGSGCWGTDLDGDGSFDLDGGYDADIVLHEFHHGVSWRLNPSFNGPEADAIGEGGGDFFAYSVFGNTRLAEYALPPAGIRGVNAKTYADFTCLFFFFCEPHDNGEIWANVLWDLRERFRGDLVLGSEAAAIGEVHRLYVDALALSPPSPTMLDLRDSMLQADGLRNPASAPGGSESYCRIWTTFAGRGLGQNALDTQDTGDNSVVANDEIPVECPQPTRVSLAVADGQAAEAGLDPASLTITRTGDTSEDLTVLYTVGGTATAGADYEALSGSLVIPAGSAAASLVVTPLDDSAFELQETVVVTLEPDAAYELRGVVTATLQLVNDDPGPDLVVSALSAPATAAPGLTIDVTDTTRNQGAGPAAASTTTFYLSTNAVFEATDLALGGRPIPELAGGAVSTASTTLQLPDTLAPGTYYVLARADGEGLVTETNEGNNQRVDPVAVGTDLVVSAFTIPTTSGAGSTISVSDTTRNQGGASAPASATSFYLSLNTVFDGTDVLLGTRSVPALGANAASTAATSLVLPATMNPGTYYVLARADGEGLVAETNEGNNQRSDAIAIGPDLLVSALTVPATTGVGSTISVSDTTRNQGGGSAPASSTSFYLSANAVFDVADVLLGARPVPALAAGASDTAATSLALPSTTAPGTYYVLARADGGGLLPESNENNNQRVAVLAVGPDLLVSALTAPTAAAAGATITVSDTTRNQGGGSAPASSTSFYLSTNAVFDGGDVLLGSRPVPALNAAASNPASTSLVLPPDTGAGLRYILARADGDELVPETSETNNQRAQALYIGPDLVVSALTAPTTAVAGTAINVSDTTRNQGAGAAAPSSTTFFLSANTVLDAADVPLGARLLPELASGAASTAVTSLEIPASTLAGVYYVLAKADGDGLVPETNENNNTRSARVTISSP
jgi:subtilase family serine protease